MLKRSSGISLPKSHPEYGRISQHLDRMVRGWDDSVERMIFYEDVGDHILIPRFFPIDEKIEDLSTYGENIKINSKISPRNNRQELSMNWFQNNEHGILRLEPAVGKTVISIHAISTFKKRALILAHKDKLCDQWRDEFIKHTDLGIDDIARLTTATIEKDLKKPIIISTVQTVMSMWRNADREKFITLLANSGIGVVIFDEVHVALGPEQFSKASLAINAKRCYGLSATPSRSDGNEDIMKYHLGDVTYFKPEENELFAPKIIMMMFPHEIFSKHTRYCMWGGKFSPGKYLQQMYRSEKYNYTVGNIIKKLYYKDRNIVTMGNRTNALLELAKASELPKHDIGIFIPGATKKEILKVSDTDDLDIAFKTKRSVFCTYGGGRDGNNRETLDALVMSTTTSNIDQAVGRIQRALEGKPQPVAIDVVDTEGPEVMLSMEARERTGLKTLPWFLRSAEKREAVYVERGWEVEKILLT